MRIKCKELLEQIEDKRKEMLEAAKTTGFLSDLTLKCSQELDELLNRYQQNM
ncbi:aspartyl-phosphate phosphatase Spo0E family protein [Bacillus tianshenii]|nr:aspartyl-phosphate phosphatase Spo0E family protein [Bacillus tianshenii]